MLKKIILFFKRLCIVVLVLAVFVFLFSGMLYRSAFSYDAVNSRDTCVSYGNEIKDYVDSKVNYESINTIDEIIDESLSITSEKLNFIFDKASNSPDIIMDTEATNCIGYSCFYTIVCNYLLNKNKLSGSWVAKPYVATIHFFNINIHNYFESPFFKDHDIVIIENVKENKRIAVDPSLNDYFWINKITIK
jgi:hypothetical protein